MALSKFAETTDIVEMVEIKLIEPSSNWIRSGIGVIEELMESIRMHGLLQPIIIRPRSRGFEVVAGHRRLEACRKLHWFVIPSIVRDVTEKEAFELSLVENVQRNTLSILEEARAFKKYSRQFGRGGIDELSSKIGKSPAYVSHIISLLKLPAKIQEKLERNEISRSVAQELLWVKDEELQLKLADISSNSGMTVKEIRRATAESYGERTGPEKIDSSDIPFSSNWVRDSPARDQTVLKKAALSLRIALIRLDSLIERTEDQSVKKFLVQKRFVIHRLIDEILKERKNIANPS